MYVLCGRRYEEGSAGSMAEESSVYELEGLEKQLQSLLSRYTSDELRADSKPFCSDFCKLVEDYASRWQVPLPQLRILELALCYFARASTSFTSNCDHVLHTLSSLALSVFELLLFFDQKDLQQEPLKHFVVTFQECYLALQRHQNVHLLQVERLVQGGGPWACPALQAILSGSNLPQNEVDVCISSELPVFFELRVRYLLSCERAGEAMALAKCCAWHPTAGQHLFFLQVYLTWLLKTSPHDSLHKEVADFTGKDAIHIICTLECEEKDEVLLALSRAFLSQQLCRGDMYYLCDLVFVWSKLHRRLKKSKQKLLEEIHQLMRSATNVNSIFPFIRAIMQEVGEDGIQFCVELCANALESCLPCDVITKNLIYKTIASLLPNDLEVCRACALLVFFLERTVEAYKTVYLLYMHPDQEYTVECSPIRNHIRFETLQVLKKDLYFDPEFWNLIALRTNCLKLMSDKVVSTALEEIMEDKWIHKYYTKEPAGMLACRKGSKGSAKKRNHKEDTDTTSKRLKLGAGKGADHTMKRKGNKGSRALKDTSSEPLRRSFWQLDRLQDNGGCGEHRRITRLSEKNPPKRRIRTPKWLLQDSGALVSQKMKKHGLKNQKHHQLSVEKRSETSPIKNNAKHKPPMNSLMMGRENNGKQQKGFPQDCVDPAAPPQVILELSLPDNELMGTFNEETCNRQRGFPQMLFYKSTVKHPAPPQPAKTVLRKEVVLRARDTAMFVQQLHCYARRLKGKGNGQNIQGSVSTITRSSVQGSPPKGPERDPCEMSDAELKGEFLESSDVEMQVGPPNVGSQKTPEKSPVEMKGQVASHSPEAAKMTEVLEKVPPAQSSEMRGLAAKSAGEMKVPNALRPEVTEAPMLDSVLQARTREHCEVSAVEMKVTIASQSPGLDKARRAQAAKDSTGSQMVDTVEIPPLSNAANISNVGTFDPLPPQSRDALGERKHLERSSQAQSRPLEVLATDISTKRASENDTSQVSTYAPAGPDCMNDMSALTLVTEMVTELGPERQDHKQPGPEDDASKESRAQNKLKGSHKLQSTSSCYLPELGASAVDDDDDDDDDGMMEGTSENSEPVESEESKLEYCCTFCNKLFKGSRVVAHAMFHYRKDECMFCGTVFEDDLLAMMHLSNHIEKLKKIKEPAANKGQESCVPETKDIPTPKTSAKSKAANVSFERRSSTRSKTSAVCPKGLQDSTPTGSRKLRSDDKPSHNSKSKHLNSKASVHKVNGHISRKKEPDGTKANPPKQQEISQKRTSDGEENSRWQENQDMEMVVKDLSCSSDHKMDSRCLKETNVGPQEKVCCPLEGCAWSTDLSKNRVALLYHALDDHYGEATPLELAFRIGNSRCSICMRVLWSFEHFQHHVERHRLTPRHPCLHQGCTARFKSGMEMRRHARRHSPLQAVCCLPGCSQLFICLWALNLHEKEHYASKPTKPDKNASKQTGERHDKQRDRDLKEETATAAVSKTPSLKASRKLRGQAAHNTSTDEHAKAPPPAAGSEPAPQLELNGNNETKVSHVLKNLSNKDTSAPPAGPNLRLRQTLRKMKATNALKGHKIISSLLKHSHKGRHVFRKRPFQVNSKRPKRRGRPPKPRKAVHDENATAGQNDEGEKTDQRTPAEPTSPSKAAETSNKSKELNEAEKSQDVKMASTDDSRCKKSPSKQIKKNHHFKQKVINQSIAQKVKKRLPPKEAAGKTAPSDSSRSKKKATNGKAGTEMKKKCPESSSKNLAEANSVDSGAAEGECAQGKVENADSMDSGSANTVPAAAADGLSETTPPPKTQTAEERSKKSLHTRKEGKKDAGKTSRKPNHTNRKGDKKMVDASKASLKKAAVAKSVDQQVEANAAADGKAEEETAAPSDAAAVAKSQKAPKDKAKKRELPKEGGAKAEVAEGKGAGQAPQSTSKSSRYTKVMNGQAAAQEPPSTVCKEALAEYGKKPYMRPPPTAYLDEKFTTMPKRRKEMASFQSQTPVQEKVAAALERHRCGNCFATFNSGEEMRSHLQLQRCASLFGFDSDDEGNS